MGRRRKTREIVDTHVRIRKDFAIEIQAIADSKEITFSKALEIVLDKGLKTKASKYKGFRQVQMSHDFTCFECLKRFKAGKLALYDTETGATMCIECAITNELTTEATAKLIIKKWRLKRDTEALKVELKKSVEEYISQTTNIAEITLFDRDRELLPKFQELMKKSDKYFQLTDIKEEKELMDALTRLYSEIISFVRDRKTEKNRIMAERQKLLEEKMKRETKGKKKQKSYAI